MAHIFARSLGPYEQAVGVEWKVSFCDHCLVKYMFNIFWEMKTFDGREMSILRATARDLLPDSIAQRR